MSLPLARELVQELGIDWTDLWNVARDEQFPQPLSSVKALPPKENVHQPMTVGWIVHAGVSIGAPMAQPVCCLPVVILKAAR